MAYSESDTRSKLIDPAIKSSGWLESNIVREYYFTDGRKLIGGKRGKRYFVDYLLTYKNTNLAIVEAKAESKDPLDGLQQSINYAQRLKIDFVYTTNGHKIYEHSLIEGKGRFIGNIPLHQWTAPINQTITSINNKGKLELNIPKNLTTWIFEEGTFVPQAKLINGKSYSIITDHLGTPFEAYSENGEKVWSCNLDIYGKTRKFTGERSFIPFLFQGQYYDEETELAYNRFRYYSPDSGTYISQDPIGLEGNNPNFYAYTFDSNSEIDPFGLTTCLLSASDTKKLFGKYKKTSPWHRHHIVREMAPSNWPKKYRNYIVDSQKILKKAGIGLNDDIRNFTIAKYEGAHGHKAAEYVYKQLSQSKDISNTLAKLGKEMNSGIISNNK